ncbi:MAG: putative zinc-binding metallopeptidase [Acidimicrobiales bacterium]
MKAFLCPTCSQPVYFENDACLRCGTVLGFDPRHLNMVARDDSTKPCINAGIARCNWLLPIDDPVELCESCRLTRIRPPADDVASSPDFADTEAAKRRLIVQLLELGLPITSREEDPDHGLAFDLLSGRAWMGEQKVVIGHDNGLITIDVHESDDAVREAVRLGLGEAYRTMLGHLRHEIGHYYWLVLVEGVGLDQTGPVDAFRELFGDERQDYGDALSNHYGSGSDFAPSGSEDWEETHVSAYATMHPWEDWAETFAHYLHIRDTLQTAASYGMAVSGPPVPRSEAASMSSAPDDRLEKGPFEDMVNEWLPLTYALNAVNRSMGSGDLYPFVLAPKVLEKLAFVDALIRPRAPVSETLLPEELKPESPIDPIAAPPVARRRWWHRWIG